MTIRRPVETRHGKALVVHATVVAFVDPNKSRQYESDFYRCNLLARGQWLCRTTAVQQL